MIAGTGCSPDGFSSDDGVERQDMIATNVKECPEIGRAVCDGAIQRLYIIKSKTRDDSFEFLRGLGVCVLAIPRFWCSIGSRRNLFDFQGRTHVAQCALFRLTWIWTKPSGKTTVVSLVQNAICQ